MSIDFEALKAANKISDIAGKSLKLTRDGAEYRALCPFHNEQTPSFTINDAKGFYHCFGCGAHGDVIDFVSEFHRVDAKKAMKMLAGGKVPKTEAKGRPPREEHDRSIYADLVPGHTHAGLPVIGRKVVTYNPKRRKFGGYKPTLVHPYMVDGKLAGVVIRAEIDGKKITPTLRWARVDAGDGMVDVWTHWPFDDPRPLYIRVPEHPKPNGQVIVVEGEKAADAAFRIMGDLTVITWPGGTNAPAKADWSFLRGLRVVLWPDNDAPGAKAMAAVYELAKAAGAESVKYLEPDPTKPEAWDAADAEADGWDRTKVLAWAATRAKGAPTPQEPHLPPAQASSESGATPPPKGKAPLDAKPAGAAGASSSPKAERRPSPPSDDEAEGFPFDCVGTSEDQSRYIFRARDTQALMSLSAHQLGTTAGLLSIYSQQGWWEAAFPGGGKGKSKLKIDTVAASAGLMGACKRNGFFDPKRIRGLGAWEDRGRTVINVGSHVIVDGAPTRLADIDSRNIYVRRDEIEAGLVEPATLAQARQFLSICGSLHWEDQLSGRLFAGWIVIATVCGVLKWRPHIWINGAPGSGKSSAITMIAKPMLGELAVTCDGHTTEAGIRQTLKTDARALFIDEFESRPNEQGDRVQQVLDLLRGASTGYTVVKGSVSGDAIQYCVRTQACLSSINPGLLERADEDRISRLTLLQDKSEGALERWQELSARITSTLTPQFAAAMFSRTVLKLDVLKRNIEMFRVAGAKVLGGQRFGDQIAPMCAGAWLCHSDEPVTAERAEQWVREKSWSEHTSVGSEEDWRAIISHLSNCQLHVAYKTGGQRRIPIEELVRWDDAGTAGPDDSVDIGEVRRQLRAHGIVVRDNRVQIANRNPNLARLFASTQWFKAWNPTLKRVPGAVLIEPRKIGDGPSTRMVEIPISHFLPTRQVRLDFDGSSDVDEPFI